MCVLDERRERGKTLSRGFTPHPKSTSGRQTRQHLGTWAPGQHLRLAGTSDVPVRDVKGGASSVRHDYKPGRNLGPGSRLQLPKLPSANFTGVGNLSGQGWVDHDDDDGNSVCGKKSYNIDTATLI